MPPIAPLSVVKAVFTPAISVGIFETNCISLLTVEMVFPTTISRDPNAAAINAILIIVSFVARSKCRIYFVMQKTASKRHITSRENILECLSFAEMIHHAASKHQNKQNNSGNIKSYIKCYVTLHIFYPPFNK